MNPLNAHESPCRSIRSMTLASAQNPAGDGSPTPRGPEVTVAASGAWSDGVFAAELRLVETPHTVLVELDPAAGAARLNWRLEPLTGPDPLSTAAFPF